jgi:hypothetical protein
MAPAQRSATRSSASAEPAASVSWTPHILAEALSTLLAQPLTAEQVRRRAVALGLLRHSVVEPRPELSARAAARLLLAGYHLPAAIEHGTLASLTEHYRAGRRILVRVAEPTPKLLEVRSVEEAVLSVADPAATAGQCWPLERFRVAWSRTGNGAIIAAQRWEELPEIGLLFFGGLRDADGAYHWNTAECDTDRQGRLLRY